RAGRRSLAAMKRLRTRQIDAAPTAPARAHRKIEIFIINEEAFVEAAERLEYAATNKEERAHHLIDGARLVMRPFDHEVRRQDRGQQPVQSETVADHAPRGRRAGGVARHIS